MSDLEQPTSFIAICERLHGQQLAAKTADEREAADAEFGHFLRMSAAGRLDEWLASRSLIETQKAKGA